MDKLFEVPYNFSKKLIAFYASHSSYISYLFVPPYKDDSLNTRSTIETKRKGSCYMPQSREEYETHLKMIVDAGLRFVVLWQVPNLLLSNYYLDYYVRLGASGFIVGNDDNATKIKAFDSNLIVVCSLIQRVCSDAIYRDFGSYDRVLLYYPFNRALDALKTLSHIKDKLVLMPNTLCHVDCPSMHHWFPKSKSSFEQKRDCPVINNVEMSGFIDPEHLYLFDNLVSGYKIQGREYSTDIIIYICSIYFRRQSAKELLNAMLGDELSESMQIYNPCINLQDYYNIKSQSIIDGKILYHR